MEVIQRIGYDSFTPDQGVLISKNKNNESARSLHPTDTSKYLNYDIYRLSYELEGEGWDAHLQSVIVAVPFGEKIKIPFGIKKSNKASNQAIIKINCTSESDPGIQAESTIVVKKNNSKYKRHP